MKREIKFRAWDLDTKTMMYDKSGYFIRASGTRFQIGTNGVCSAVYLEDSVIKKPIIMQFTGLHDIDGKEIYEGDKFKSPDDDREYLLVYWNNELSKFAVALYGFDMYHNEGGGEEFDSEISCIDDNIVDLIDMVEDKIIGNIYEN